MVDCLLRGFWESNGIGFFPGLVDLFLIISFAPKLSMCFAPSVSVWAYKYVKTCPFISSYSGSLILLVKNYVISLRMFFILSPYCLKLAFISIVILGNPGSSSAYSPRLCRKTLTLNKWAFSRIQTSFLYLVSTLMYRTTLVFSKYFFSLRAWALV